MDAIEAVDVTKEFGAGADLVRALDRVSVGIRHNELFTLLGPSGCGKTTLLRLIAGFEQPTSGEIRLDGQELSGLPPFERPINTVFQSYALFPHLSVARNVAFGLEMQRRPKAEIEARVETMLALVKLAEHGNRRTAQLSGGQQQRVALARALAPAPRVLLLDEPLSALDLKLRKEMQIELKRLQTETGITFVFVTHDQEEALTMSDRVAVMRQGRILQTGSPREIYEHPVDRFVADFIGETNFLTGDIRGGMVELAGGARLPIAAGGRGGRVTLAVRPERIDLAPAGHGLEARLTRAVYFGTDTILHAELSDGTPITVRRQNREGAATGLEPGAALALAIPPEALQVLAD